MTLEIRETTPEATRIIAERLRDADEVEVFLLTGKPSYEALCESIAGSEASYCGYFDGEPGGIFGLGKLNDEVGIPWMVGTPLMVRHSREWLPRSKAMIEWMHNRYPVLTNIVHGKNAKSIRWLHRLGFEFLPNPVPGFPGFIQFYKEKPCA